MLRLGVTRPPEQLTDLCLRAAGRNVTVVPLPLIASIDELFDWPDNLPVKNVDWVVFTSAQGVTSFFRRVEQLRLSLPDRTKYAVVGAKTARALTDLDRVVDFQPSDSYGQLLFEEFVDFIATPTDTVIYARAAEVNYDPAGLFERKGLTYVPIICYRTVSQTVESGSVAQLTNDDYILFTAPSTVDAYQEQFGKPLARPIAIGRSTAAQMNEYGWSGFITMKNADIDNVLEYL